MGQVVGIADPRQAGGGFEQDLGELTGDHVGLVTVGDRQDQIGLFDAGLDQHVGVGGMAVDGAQIEPFLEQLQELRIAIDHRDVVFLAGQALGHGATDLTGAKDENIHGS